MSKKRKLTHDLKIVEALNKVKIPIRDEARCLDIYFKDVSRSNESGKEHIAKGYHDLTVKDIERINQIISDPFYHSKDKRYTRTYCYYGKRKVDRNYIKIVIKIEKRNPKIGFIASIFITKKVK